MSFLQGKAWSWWLQLHARARQRQAAERGTWQRPRLACSFYGWLEEAKHRRRARALQRQNLAKRSTRQAPCNPAVAHMEAPYTQHCTVQALALTTSGQKQGAECLHEPFQQPAAHPVNSNMHRQPLAGRNAHSSVDNMQGLKLWLALPPLCGSLQAAQIVVSARGFAGCHAAAQGLAVAA